MKICVFILCLLVSSPNFCQSDKPFQKSISIDEYFAVEYFKDSEHYEKLKAFSVEMTDRVANKIISYQQEYDFKFHRNYKNQIKIPSELVIGSRIINREQKNFESEFWFYNKHIKGDYFFELTETDTAAQIPHKSMSIPFTVEELRTGEIYKKMMKGIDDFAEGMVSYSYFITSQRLNPSNKMSDSLMFTIENVFENKTTLDISYTEQLTNLANNAIISEQIVKRDEKGATNFQWFPFRYYQNYLKDERKRRPSQLIIFGQLTFDDAMRYYYLDIDLMIDGEIMQIPEEFDHRMAFNEEEMYSYSKVASPIRGRIGTLLFIYYELHLKEIPEDEE